MNKTEWKISQLKTFNKFCANMKTIFTSLDIRDGKISQGLRLKYIRVDISSILPENLKTFTIGNLDNFMALLKPLEKVKDENLLAWLEPMESNSNINYLHLSTENGKTSTKILLPMVDAIPDKYKEVTNIASMVDENLVANFEIGSEHLELLKSTKKLEMKMNIFYNKSKNTFSIICKQDGGMYDIEMAKTESKKANIVLNDESAKYYAPINYDTLHAFASSAKINFMDLYIEDNNDVILLVSNWVLDETTTIDLYERSRIKAGKS